MNSRSAQHDEISHSRAYRWTRSSAYLFGDSEIVGSSPLVHPIVSRISRNASSKTLELGIAATGAAFVAPASTLPPVSVCLDAIRKRQTAAFVGTINRKAQLVTTHKENQE